MYCAQVHAMNFFNMLINDPVVPISMIRLLIVLGICCFYIYYFLNNITDDANKNNALAVTQRAQAIDLYIEVKYPALLCIFKVNFVLPGG